MVSTGIRLKDRVAIVTGGGSGIGRAYALGLAGEGARVVIADIDEGVATATAASIQEGGGEALAMKTDVSHWPAVEQMAQETVRQYGGIDILVNNAAIWLRVPLNQAPFWELPEEEWDRVMAVNMKGPFLCAKAVVPQMKAQGKGKIINVASGTVFSGLPMFLHYVSSKGGIIAMTRSLARELGDFGINVNCIAPGAVTTEATDAQTMERQQRVASLRCLKRLQYPDDLVGTVLFLASDESDFITGQTIVVDGGRVMH